jgi:hypothetical protein
LLTFVPALLLLLHFDLAFDLTFSLAFIYSSWVHIFAFVLLITFVFILFPTYALALPFCLTIGR